MPTIPLQKLVGGVSENGDFLVFYVASSRPEIEPHRVDLQRYNGNGSCDCENFQYKKRPLLEKRAMPAEILECKHIKRAKRYLLWKVLNKMIETREDQSNANKEKAAQTRAMDRSVQKPAQSTLPPGSGGQAKTFRLGQGKTPFAAAQDKKFEHWGPPE